MIHRSGHPECGIERLKQSRLAEWLEEALHGPQFEHPWTNTFISASGDEHDRNLLPAERQFPLQIGSRHARRGDVEYQTSCPANTISREELLRRRERLDVEAE